MLCFDLYSNKIIFPPLHKKQSNDTKITIYRYLFYWSSMNHWTNNSYITNWNWCTSIWSAPYHPYGTSKSKIVFSVCQLLSDFLICKILNKIYKENQRLSPFKSLLSLLFTAATPLLRSVRGWFHWLLLVANEHGGGRVYLCVLQLNHTVLNMTFGSTKGLVSLWLLSGRHDYWSEWQIKAGNWAGGWRQGVYGMSVGVCTEEENIVTWSKTKWHWQSVGYQCCMCCNI